MISSGGADILLALEPAEALRFAHYLSPNGIALVNTRAMLPITVTTGKASYPPVDEILRHLRSICKELKPLDATNIAMTAGSPQVMNVVMVGALSKYFPLPEELLLEALCEVVPAKYLDINRHAFELGKAEVE
jgi:indolepyruvate ferredoxin oxidoreductase beta subunit